MILTVLTSTRVAFSLACLSRLGSYFSIFSPTRRTWMWWGCRSVRHGWQVMFNSEVWASRGGQSAGFFLLTNRSQQKLQPATFVRCVIIISIYIFIFVIHRIPALHSLNQISSALQRPGGGRLLIISVATLEGATLFMPIKPSGVGVEPLMSNTPVLWSSLFLLRHQEPFFFFDADYY